MLLIIIFFLLNFNKVSPNVITEKVFSQPFFYSINNIINDFLPYTNTYTNTYSNAYSINFYSNNFLYSNNFYSNSFANNYISYSFYASNQIKSNNLYITQINSNSQNLFKSMQTWSLKSTPTYQPTILLTINPTISPSHKPTNHPTFIPTLEPTTLLTIKPIHSPTLLPTMQPTFIIKQKPTLMPTRLPTQLSVSLLKLETSMTLSGFTKNVLDEKSLTAIILSIAQSANITSNYVSIKEYSFINARRRYLTFTLFSLYNLYLTSQIIIPINSQNINPFSLYTSLTNNIQYSINSGTFITYLLSNAAVLNASISSNNMTISNYTVSQMTIIGGSPTFMPTTINYGKSVPSLTTIYVVKLVFITMACFIVFLFIFGLVLKKVNNYNDYNNNIISHNEVQISV